MIVVTLNQAEKLVRSQANLGNDVRWDGWDIVFFRPSDHGRTSKQGAFRNGQWGFDNRFKVDSKGLWKIDARNVRSSKVSRNRF